MQPGLGTRSVRWRIVLRIPPCPFGALDLKLRIDCKNIKRVIVNQAGLRLGITWVSTSNFNR
jgi:hypothetical protein